MLRTVICIGLLLANFLAGHCVAEGSKTLRGFNVNLELTEKDFKDLQKLKVNAVRVSFADVPMFLDGGELNPIAVDALHKYITFARGTNIGLIIDPHTFPGSKKKYSGSTNDQIWNDSDLRQRLIGSFVKMVQLFKPEKCILGYDLINEPAPPLGANGLNIYHNFVQSLIKAIRVIDKDKIVIIEPPISLNQAGVPSAQYKMWKEIEDFKGVGLLKSIHYYEPGDFTHQAILNFRPNVKLPFPLNTQIGLINYFRLTLGEIIASKSRVMIGEFSVSSHAKNSDVVLYLDTLIQLFEDNGWDWFYHAFREVDAWNPELIENEHSKLVQSMNSERMRVLKKYLNKNTPIECL